MNTNTRKYYIDNLRSLILLILVPYHTAMAWNTWGEPNYIIFNSSKVISSIIVFFSPFFMPILFVLAGASTKYALQKRSIKEYLLERIKKLFVPFLFGTLVFMPIIAYIADKYNCSYRGGFFEHYGIFFTKYTDLIGADGGFSLGQFWFLIYLLIISFVGIGIINLLTKLNYKLKKDISFITVILLGLPLPILSEILSIGGKSFAEYIYLFLIGYYIFTNENIISKIEKYSLEFGFIGIVATIISVYLFIWSDMNLILVNTATKYIAEWFMIIATIGLSKKTLNFSGKVSNYMCKRSFLLYIYHFIWIVLFQYLLYGIVGNNTGILFFGTILLSYLTTFTCCEISINIPILCFLTGVRYKIKE